MLAWVLAACSATAPGDSASGRPSDLSAQPLSPAGSVASSKPLPSGSLALPESIVDPVIADVAKLAGVPKERVLVEFAAAMSYPDGGLGCPEPGVAYPQVPVEGWRIVASVAGTVYDYRGSSKVRLRRCDPAQPY